ncbi:hypothetical protein BU23DRAFT_548205 [Bimuria novae-zelandiae CBS 107.79]|uniref:RING-type domain-containing protein n=1 Tax=Bimuria novae-zelandiae CBS 107.79 TaxID=1447943 RepID=A0A6A5VTS7_9PLEO|nr:hypothetical protein BU23DRAFT_548205 [Bimuria novae-zelandiae CBS 107.79]
MTSVFSSLVRPPKLLSKNSGPSASESLAFPILAPDPESSDGDVRDLNASLQALTDIFPDIQPEAFRELLSSLGPESRLEVVTEQLLRHGAKWARGRYRMPAEQEEQQAVAHKYKYRNVDTVKDTRGVPLAREDKFRSKAYKNAAKEALYGEFKGLSHSTIRAVLAEYNWSYTQARPTLLGLSSHSWRSSITNFLMRRKAPSANDHPLVMWLGPDAKTGRGRKPLLVKTKSLELDQELYETLIVPELEKQRKEQERHDFELALKWNEEQAEADGELYDCECCFIPNTLQQMSTCDAGSHYICFRCIRHAITTALYDQGWARNINTDLCTLKCIAPMTDGIDDCTGCVPLVFVKRALLEEPNGEDTYRKLNERFSSEAMLKSQLPLIRCPFCAYAEVDDLALPSANLLASLRFKKEPLIFASVSMFQILCFQALRVVVFFIFLFLAFIIVVNSVLPQPFALFSPIQKALRRIHLKRRGLRFQCLSPACGRLSCLSCSAPWHDPHTCYSSQLTSLRLTLERATTDAVKRTCPSCSTSFVKSEGCNKLVCICGYSMCYICREGLVGVGYQHFCQHFRAVPGSKCTECEKCDLYRVEDEDVVVRRAKESAEKEWWERQGIGAQEGLKERAGRQRVGSESGKRRWIKWDDVTGWTEDLVDSVVV